MQEVLVIYLLIGYEGCVGRKQGRIFVENLLFIIFRKSIVYLGNFSWCIIRFYLDNIFGVLVGFEEFLKFIEICCYDFGVFCMINIVCDYMYKQYVIVFEIFQLLVIYSVMVKI